MDSDSDGLPDSWELERSGFLDGLNSADATTDPDGNGRSFLQEYQAENALPVAVAETSPVNGDSEVSVSRETVFRLSDELAADAVVNVSRLYAEFAGRRLLGRVELSTDRRTLSLYYLENLPAGARVRVTLVGDGLKGANGLDLDANGDGLPGGVGTIHFDTFSAVPVSQTAVIGHVFASEPEPGPQPGMFINRPLLGVTVTVDGAEETLRTTTDAQGFFRLSPAPAGRFFVHVDGRTAVGSQWPAGDYYPFVGKAWEAIAGVETNLAGGSGEIFIASSRDITVNGAIEANGGDIERSGASNGGRGSGGAILLRADRISGTGRLEAFYRRLAGQTRPVSVNSAPIANTDFNTLGSLTVTRIAGNNVPPVPSGNTLTPDVIFTSAGPIAVTVQGAGIPVGTPVRLRVTTSEGVISAGPINLAADNTAVFSDVNVPAGIGTIQAFAEFQVSN